MPAEDSVPQESINLKLNSTVSRRVLNQNIIKLDDTLQRYLLDFNSEYCTAFCNLILCTDAHMLPPQQTIIRWCGRTTCSLLTYRRQNPMMIGQVPKVAIAVASGGHKHGEDEGRMLCRKFATVSWSGLGSGRPSMLMLVRSMQSAAVLATMRPVLLFGVLKKAARR